LNSKTSIHHYKGIEDIPTPELVRLSEAFRAGKLPPLAEALNLYPNDLRDELRRREHEGVVR
jgi:hypothetical protein